MDPLNFDSFVSSFFLPYLTWRPSSDNKHILYWMLGAGALGRPRGMVRGGRREEGSGWGTRVYLWWIHVDIWQNQYNVIKLKNKIKIRKKSASTQLMWSWYVSSEPWFGQNITVLLFQYECMAAHLCSRGLRCLRLSLKMSFIVILGDSRGFEIDLPGI